jgi:hypothetical protein
VSKPFLNAAKAQLTHGGVLIMNVACRASALYGAVIAAVASVFDAVYEISVQEVRPARAVGLCLCLRPCPWLRLCQVVVVPVCGCVSVQPAWGCYRTSVCSAPVC